MVKLCATWQECGKLRIFFKKNSLGEDCLYYSMMSLCVVSRHIWLCRMWWGCYNYKSNDMCKIQTNYVKFIQTVLQYTSLFMVYRMAAKYINKYTPIACKLVRYACIYSPIVSLSSLIKETWLAPVDSSTRVLCTRYSVRSARRSCAQNVSSMITLVTCMFTPWTVVWDSSGCRSTVWKSSICKTWLCHSYHCLV